MKLSIKMGKAQKHIKSRESFGNIAIEVAESNNIDVSYLATLVEAAEGTQLVDEQLATFLMKMLVLTLKHKSNADDLYLLIATRLDTTERAVLKAMWQKPHSQLSLNEADVLRHYGLSVSPETLHGHELEIYALCKIAKGGTVGHHIGHFMANTYRTYCLGLFDAKAGAREMAISTELFDMLIDHLRLDDNLIKAYRK